MCFGREFGNIINVDLREPLKRITILRTFSQTGREGHIPCVSLTHPQILRNVVPKQHSQNKTHQAKLCKARSLTLPKNLLPELNWNYFVALRAIPATFTAQKGRKLHQPHPGILWSWKSPNKAEPTKLYQPSANLCNQA